MSWPAVNAFLDHLEPCTGQEFEEWFEKQWAIHYRRCANAAKHIYIMEHSIAEAGTLKELEEHLRANAHELGFDIDAFMELAWPRAKKKFEQINDDA